jgi:hypothetical protein
MVTSVQRITCKLYKYQRLLLLSKVSMRFHEIPFLKLFIGLVAGILLYPYFNMENILGLWLISTLFIGICFIIYKNETVSAIVFYPFFTFLIISILFFRMASLNPINKSSYLGNHISAVKFQ